MTWVILGHNFAFGASLLHLSNKSFIDSIYMKEQGMAIEAIMEGWYIDLNSVPLDQVENLFQESFLWTLSYLLEPLLYLIFF